MSNALDQCDAGLRFGDRPSIEPVAVRMPDRIARLCGAPPLQVLPRAWGTQLSAARWKFSGVTTLQLPALDELVLGCRASGTATVVRSVGGERVRKRPVLGAISVMTPAPTGEWQIEGACEVIHVYIPRAALQDFSRKAFGSDLSHLVRDFVGVRHRWLCAYFQMLAAEIDGAAAHLDSADSPFLAETQGMLLRHLIEWHSDATRADLVALERGRPVSALRDVVLRRVKDFVETNLAGEIHLGQLAAVACMSDDHFLRSFRAACGTTPYQYVIEKRVERAAALLADTRIPIREIARVCGFKSAPQLSLRFRAVMGMRPSRYRASARP